MKIAYKTDLIERKNSECCIVQEYPALDHEIDFAVVNINGRYPANKRAVNLVCKEMIYVHQGQGQVEVNGECYSLTSGDLILIEAGEAFFWDGKLTLHISCRPSFTVAQHQLVD